MAGARRQGDTVLSFPPSAGKLRLSFPLLHQFSVDPTRGDTALPNRPGTSSGLLLLHGGAFKERAALQFLLPHLID